MFRGLPAEDNLCTLALCVSDMFEDLFDGGGIDEGTLGCRRIKTEAKFEFRNSLLEEFSKLVVNIFMYEETVCTGLVDCKGCVPNTSLP